MVRYAIAKPEPLRSSTRRSATPSFGKVRRHRHDAGRVFATVAVAEAVLAVSRQRYHSRSLRARRGPVGRGALTSPDVTVVVAVYNTMPYLTECL